MGDLQAALRVIAKRPGFTLTVVITLALGIGATTAMFSIVNGVLMTPLPYAGGERLVLVQEQIEGTNPISVVASYPNFVDWEANARSFDGLAAMSGGTLVLTGADDPLRLAAVFVSPAYFSILSANMTQGRPFGPEQNQRPGGHQVVVISHGLWTRQFGADASLVGRAIILNGRPYVVSGIVEQAFQDPLANPVFPVDLWIPIMMVGQVDRDGDAVLERRQRHRFSVLGRLAPAVTLQQAREEMAQLADRLEQTYPGTNQGFGATVEALRERLIQDVRDTLILLFVGAGALLVIACVNVANLLLVQSTDRQREIAVRTALGAGRRRLIEQFMVESLVLTLAGGLLGVGLAHLTLATLVRLSPTQLPNLGQVRIDVTVLIVSLVITLATGVVLGLLPALRTSSGRIRESLADSPRHGASRGGRRLQHGLVIVEVATAMMLLTGAGLLLRSFLELRSTGPGYLTDGFLAVAIELPVDKYPGPEELRVFGARLGATLGALPGVEWSGLWSPDRPGATVHMRTVIPEGTLVERQSESFIARKHMIHPGALAGMEIALVRGREFGGEDRWNSPPVTVISAALANALWPGEGAVGRRLHEFRPPGANPIDYPLFTVIGIAANASQGGRLASEGTLNADFDIYFLYDQLPQRQVTALIKTSADPRHLTGPVREAVQTIDPSLPVFNVQTIEDQLADEESPARFTALLMSVFGGLALFLAAIGVYGVLSYAVSQRTREIGLRAALGADPRATVRLFVGQGLRLAGAGLGLGAVLAFNLRGLVASLLFGVSALDPLTLGGAAALLLITAATACYLPARRAARVAPIVALRVE